MKTLWRLAYMFPIAAASCVSPHTIAREYSAAGKHELAVQYFSEIYLGDLESKEGRDAFQQSLSLAHRNILSDYETATKANDPKKAMQIATRGDELSRWAYGLRLPGVNPDVFKEQVTRARKQALKSAIQKMDDHALENGTKEKSLRSNREAMALAPDDSELNRRYERLRNRLRKHVRVTVVCTDHGTLLCHSAKAQLMAQLTKVNRELFVLSSDASKLSTAHLILEMSTVAQEGKWNLKRSGTSSGRVKVKNEFKEVRKKKNDKPVYREVKARYSVFGWTNRGGVNVKVRIEDLRPPIKVLYQYDKDASETDSRSYYTWTGDERALQARNDIKGLGTNQSPPVAASQLVRRAWMKLVDEVSEQVAVALEK